MVKGKNEHLKRDLEKVTMVKGKKWALKTPRGEKGGEGLRKYKYTSIGYTDIWEHKH